MRFQDFVTVAFAKKLDGVTAKMKPISISFLWVIHMQSVESDALAIIFPIYEA